MSEPSTLFTRLAPILRVSDLAKERAFYEALGLPVTYEGPEYPDFVAFGTESDSVHFGIEATNGELDPPTVLTFQIGVTDVDAAMARCAEVELEYELEHNDPAPGWSYRRLLLRSPSGYRVALEGLRE
jgi:catechol 2,3-dioxygenase-like lactoylglutathione lyase family enzyme